MQIDKFRVKNADIDWNCSGDFSFTAGFGATKAERALANYAAFCAPVILYFLVWQDLEWSLLQLIVASALVLDMVGGVITNSLGSMKRFLHTDQSLKLSWLGRLVGSKFVFPAIHFQIFVAPLCFDVTWSYGFFWYGLMMASILVLHLLPLYLHRPVALLIVMLSIIIGQVAFSAPAGLEWLAPIYIIKLVLSHGVREEPYRPAEVSERP
ncbi:hypothetical protein MIB92_08595 [Aestuariirhabdus sp. Z084]|uniref:hypothetical protein n=1 Tax=Aestuariirhabdus haliotis TaxID=2918751 RepID=UPI00201B3A6A|nr:hypothetical protein [Aestuariirhabdus haliotis]MCL6415707.1 hypothetical protein [Aestuariirhabdus haliotis]MCL6419767.1 hypothetical protein [Aestuariirhabdus haliotis]